MRKLEVVLASSAAVLLLFTSSGLHGQTAHFSGVESVVPSSALSNPHQMAVDSSGNVYIADDGNNRILKETPTAGGYQESTVASSGLNTPTAVAVDTSGNLYVVDAENKRILKETPSSGSYTQTALPISGLSLPIDIAVDASGDLYISDYGNANVVKETLVGTNYTQSLVVGLGGPYLDGVAVDGSGNVYVCDSGAQYILKMTPNGNGYSVAYIGSLLSQPHGIAVDASGVVYIADSGNTRIVREVPSGSTYNQSLVMSTGSVQTQSLALDSNQNLYFNDPTGGRILELAQGGVIFGTSTVGTPSAPMSLTFTFDSAGPISAPSVVTQGATGLDFTDAGTGTCTTNGTTHTYNAGDSCTVDVSFTPTHAGASYGAGLLLNSSGSVIGTGYVVGTGSGPQVTFPPGSQSQLSLPGVTNPYAVAVDAAGNLYVAQAIAAYDPSNSLLKESWNGGGYTGTTIASGFGYPTGIAIDGAGNVYVADQDGLTVYKETPTANGGYVQSVVDNTLGTVGGIAVDGAGNVYVGRGGIGVEKETLLGGSYVPSEIFYTFYAYSIAVDPSGALYFATSTGIIKETPSASGYVQSTIGTIEPLKISVDGFGNVFAANGFSNGSIWEEVNTGSSYNQTQLVSGFDDLIGIATDGSGDVFFCSDSADQVWELNFSTPPILHFAAKAIGQTSSDSPQTVNIENSGNAAMNVPQPSQGSNPSVPSGFTLNDNVASACPLVDANSPSAGTLAAGASCNLTISFSPQLSTDTSGWVTYTYDGPNGTGSTYQTSAIPLIAGGAQLASTLTWANPSSIVYGIALGGQQLNASANVPGTFSYSPAAGSILTAGSHALSVTFTPTDSTDFTTATAQVTINVTQATPSISWATPSAITYGTALSAPQLNASSPVAGTFFYSPAAGTVLTAGSQALSVTFTPTDTTDYTTATAQVTLTVSQATPTITWATPTAITYGTALSSTQLDATASVPGTFFYSSPAGTVLTAGSHAITATFTPTDTTDYKSNTATVYLTVNQATPTITWATPAAITYGTALSGTELNATASVPGTFYYSTASGSVLTAGSHLITASFYPTDSTDYVCTTASVTLVVNEATPTISWTAPTAITYGTALSSMQLNARATGSGIYASTTVSGSFAYSPALGIVPGAGSQTLSTTFTPADTTDYTTATASVTLAVNQATPTITWPTPAAITYGTVLSGTQLNASTSVAGTFIYSPAAGNVLPAGQQTLKATFTPADTTDYTAATASVTLSVNQATPAVTWPIPAAITYGTALSGTQLDASSSVAGTFAYAPAAGTVLTAGQQTLKATFTPTDAADYTTATATVTLTVNDASPTITWATPSAITYGAGLGSAQLNATSSVAGSFAYTPASGTVLGAGPQTLTATFTPTDNADYKTATATVTLTVNKATPTVAWATPGAIISGTPLSATQLDATASVPGSFIYNPAAGATLPVGNNTLSATFTPTDDVDYAPATASVTLAVNNPVPFLGNITPAIADAGGTAFTITVNGSGFLANSTVYWGTTALTTQFVSTSQLTATVTAADIATPGATAITVQTPAPGGGTSDVLQFEVDSSSGTATAPSVPNTVVTVTAGSTATYSISFPAAVTSATATCLNLPAGALCSYSTSSKVLTISTSSTTPAGTYQITVVFAETVASTASAGILLPFLLLPLFFLRRKLASRGMWSAVCLSLILLAATAFSVGCGGSSSGTTTTQSVTSSGVVGITVQ